MKQTDLQRQLAFIGLLAKLENQRVLKLKLGTTSRLNGLLAVERTLTKMVMLEEVGAEIRTRNAQELAFKELTKPEIEINKTKPWSSL